MREKVTRITTVDGKTYELPGDDDVPQLWEVTLSIGCIDKISGCSLRSRTECTLHVERKTLEDCGLLPQPINSETPEEAPEETPEDLILRLLEHVGVFPE